MSSHDNSAENDDTVNGMVDFEARPAKRSQSGYWRSACYIIGVGATERFAYYGIASNLITYLTGPLGQSTAAAAVNINIWAGTALLLPLFGAFVAESFLGRYRTIVISSLLYILALALLTTCAFLESEGDSNIIPHHTNHLKVLFFYASLYLMAIGQGAYKPCIMAFGVDQFDDQDPNELKSRSSFFNWLYFGLCAGPLAALLALNYIQDNISWGIGFGIPCISMVIALAIFMLGTKTYRYRIKTDEKCAVYRVGQVFIKAVMNRRIIHSRSGRFDEEGQDTIPHLHSQQFKSLDRALLVPEEVSRNSEIEESKALIKLLPLWITSLPLALVVAQSSTLFTTQGITMDRSIGSKFDLPAASLQYTMAVTIIIFIPIYDRIFVPLARKITKIPSGITQLQRIETGLFLCTLSIVIAALVERKRLRTASVYGLSDSPEARIPMSFFWLMPQYVIFGISVVFALIGLQEVFYDQMPCGLKAVGLSVYLSIFGIGSFLSSFMIWVIQRVSSEDGQEGWFSDNTNRAHFDYFYWLLGGLNATGFLAFLYCAKSLDVNNGNRVGTIV